MSSLLLPSPPARYDRWDQAQTRDALRRRLAAVPDTWTGSGKGVQQKAPSLSAPTVDTGTLRVTTKTALAASGAVSLDPTLGEVFTLTPTGAVTLSALSAAVGSRVYLVTTTSGTTSFALTFGTAFKSQGALSTGTVSGKVLVVAFVGDGTNLNEVSRTAAM